MAKDASGSLDDHFSEFVERQVPEGRYDSAGDVVHAALHLEEREARSAALRLALIEGEQSGASTPFDFESFIVRKRAEFN